MGSRPSAGLRPRSLALRLCPKGGRRLFGGAQRHLEPQGCRLGLCGRRPGLLVAHEGWRHPWGSQRDDPGVRRLALSHEPTDFRSDMIRIRSLWLVLNKSEGLNLCSPRDGGESRPQTKKTFLWLAGRDELQNRRVAVIDDGCGWPVDGLHSSLVHRSKWCYL